MSGRGVTIPPGGVGLIAGARVSSNRLRHVTNHLTPLAVLVVIVGPGFLAILNDLLPTLGGQ